MSVEQTDAGAAPMSATVRTKPAGCLMLPDRRGTLHPRRPPVWGDPVDRPLGFKTIGRIALGSTAPEEGRRVAGTSSMIVARVGAGGAPTDRLVAALVIMVQQANRNRPDGAGTLPPPAS